MQVDRDTITPAYVEEMLDEVARRTGHRLANDRFGFVPALLAIDRERAASARPATPGDGAAGLADLDEARRQVAAAYAEADAERRRAEAAERERDAARAVLRRVEYEGSWDRCPCCLALPPYHAPDCALAAALAAPQPSGDDLGDVRGNPGDANLPRGEKVVAGLAEGIPSTASEPALGIPISEQCQPVKADPGEPGRAWENGQSESFRAEVPLSESPISVALTRTEHDCDG